MLPKIIIVATGGTIAMRYDPVLGGVFPAATGAELLELVPPLANICAVEVVEFSNVPSVYITPQIMFELAQTINQLLLRPDVSGIVVTHGTDTLEETAYFLDLFLNSDKPVCLTAAMRNGTDLSPDGPANIFCAAATAASKAAAGQGVLVVANEEIHAAREVTKSHAANPKTFMSPFWGPVGYVDPDRVIFRRLAVDRETLQPEALSDSVYLVKLVTGTDTFLLDCLAEKPEIGGVVIEAFGRGNVPPAILPSLKKLLDRNIPVVLTSRVFGGRVLDVYGYEGAAKTLKNLGVILGGEISGPKARIKLLLALGLTRDRQELQKYFDTP